MYEEYDEAPVTVEIEYKSGITEERTFTDFDRVIIYDADQDERPYDPYGDGRVGAVVRVIRPDSANTAYFNVIAFEVDT